MKNNIDVNISGYIALPRALLCYKKKNNLSFSEFCVYLCLIMQADFDKRHKRYGVIIREDAKIAELLNCDKTTIYKQKKKLLAKGFIRKEHDYYCINNFDVFDPSFLKEIIQLTDESLQKVFADPQQNIAKLLFDEPNIIVKKSKHKNKGSKFSFNSSLSVSDEEHMDADESMGEEINKYLTSHGL